MYETVRQLGLFFAQLRAIAQSRSPKVRETINYLPGWGESALFDRTSTPKTNSFRCFHGVFTKLYQKKG
ncbi:hypothetical protein QUB63_26715 [Microcoleus sp. ARI1-B5]|uniref:hypothetical protein n=1 Tax=unclassified Microcoleus TaxID=2642155 RepID=UPI002FD65B91